MTKKTCCVISFVVLFFAFMPNFRNEHSELTSTRVSLNGICFLKNIQLISTENLNLVPFTILFQTKYHIFHIRFVKSFLVTPLT